jgi:hypothetical protein
VPARGFFCFFANPHPGGPGSPVDRHKDRSARSVLNCGSVLKAKRAKPPSANAAGNPVLGLSHRVEPVASAASASAGRRARRTTSSAQPRLARILVGQCAFRRSASLFVRGGESFSWLRTEQDSGATASRERFLTSSLPGLTRQSMLPLSEHLRRVFRSRHFGMDHRVKPGGDESFARREGRDAS